MENIFTPAVIWFIVGFVLFLLEFVVPGLIFFFFAVGAWVVAILCTFLHISINIQLLIFLFTSVISVLLLRKWVKNLLRSKKTSTEVIENEFIGKTAIVETEISPGRNGKVDFRGVSWDASSDETIAPGQTVTIIGTKSIVLIVKSNK